MSRSKSVTEDEAVEVLQVEEVAESPAVETKEKAVSAAEKKMGVSKYLQSNPQNPYIEAILKSENKLVFKTKSEWDATVEEIRTRKIK